MRAFEYDAFISHNQFDGAKSLAAELKRHRARVFCDEAIDLSDQRVRGRIEGSLMSSRCIVLHVTPGFRDSEWCQAEYKPALAHSVGRGVTRVVVARTAPDAQVPASLTAAPVFDVPNSTPFWPSFSSRRTECPTISPKRWPPRTLPHTELSLGHAETWSRGGRAC